MKNRKTLNIDSKKFNLLIERMDKKYTYEESINKIKSLIVEGPGKKLSELIQGGAGFHSVDVPPSLTSMKNIFDIKKPVDMTDIDGVLNKGVDGIISDFQNMGRELSALDQKSLKNVFSYLEGIKSASDNAGDALININKNLKNNTNLDFNQRVEFIDEVYKDNPAVLDDVYLGKTDLNNVKNRNGEFNSKDAIESRIKDNFLSLDLDDIEFLYKNSTYTLRFSPKKVFRNFNLKSGDLIVWKSSWGKGKYYIIPYENTSSTLIRNLEDNGYKTYTGTNYAGFEDSLPTGRGKGTVEDPLMVASPGLSALKFLLGTGKSGGLGGIWFRNKAGKRRFPSYIFIAGSKLTLLLIECTTQQIFGNQKINKLVDGVEEEYTFNFGDCFFGQSYETKDGLESYEPWFYLWHGYNIVIPEPLPIVIALGGGFAGLVIKYNLKNRQEEYLNRFMNDLNALFENLTIRQVLSEKVNIDEEIDKILMNGTVEKYFKVIGWVSGIEYNEQDVKEFVLSTIEGVSEAEVEGKEKQEEVRKKLEEELGGHIQINNDISKEGDTLYDIEINNLKQTYINKSKIVKGQIINEKLDTHYKSIEGEAEEKRGLCKGMEVELDLYSDNGWKVGDSRSTLSDDNCKDSKDNLVDIIYVMETNDVKGYEGLKDFTKRIKCNLLILKDSYEHTCENNDGSPVVDVEEVEVNGTITYIQKPTTEYDFQKIEEKETNGKKGYIVVAGFDSIDLAHKMMSMSGSIINDPNKGIKFLIDNGLEYRVGKKGTSAERKFCVKLTEKNLRTLETHGNGGFCSKSADKAKCINKLIEMINGDEDDLKSWMNTWNGCEGIGWE
jgi:hypothetical protein